MFNEDYKLLVTILDKINELKIIEKAISSSEEFSCNDGHIKLGVGFLIELNELTNKISALTVLASPYLTKELPLLNRYKECIFKLFAYG